MSEKYKFSKKSIIVNLFALISTLFFLSIWLVAEIEFFKDHIMLSILITVFSIILCILLAFLLWSTKYFCVNENEIIYSSGILFKNKVSLRFDKISNIKIERNLIDIIFGLAKLKLNSGSVVSTGSEIKLSLDYSYAEVLKNYFDYVLKNPQQTKIENFPHPQRYSLIKKGNAECRDFSLKEKFILPFITTGSVIATLSIIIGLGIILFFGEFIDTDINEESEFIFRRFNSAYLGWKIFAISVVVIVSYIFRIIYLLLKYYNFTLVRNGNQIHLKYGLINQRSYTINLSKINAVIIKQSILQRLLKYGELNLSFVGNFIGDTNKQDNKPTRALIPMIKIDYIKPFMEKYLNEFYKEFDIIKPKRHRILHFVWIPMLFILIPASFIPLSFIVLEIPIWIIPSITGGIFVLGLFLQLMMMSCAGLGINDDLILVSNGTLAKNTYLIKKTAIQFMKITAGPIRRKQDLCSLIIKYREAFSFIYAKHYNLDLAKKLEDDLCSN